MIGNFHTSAKVSRLFFSFHEYEMEWGILTNWQTYHTEDPKERKHESLLLLLSKVMSEVVSI